MKHEKNEDGKKSTKHTHANGSILCVWLPFSLFVYSESEICLCCPPASSSFSSTFSLTLFCFISLFILSPYLGIFLKSAFLFNGFGVNQISNNFSTPSKKCGLLMVSVSAIVWIREFSILIDFRFSFLLRMDSSLAHLFSVVTMLECQSERKIFNRASFSLSVWQLTCIDFLGVIVFQSNCDNGEIKMFNENEIETEIE